MSQYAEGGQRPTGRHRSAWERARPAPILPRRRGRVVAIVVAVVVAIATVLLLRAWLRPSDEAPAPGADGVPLSASSEQEPGSPSTGSPAVDGTPTAEASEPRGDGIAVTASLEPGGSATPSASGRPSSRPSGTGRPPDRPAGPTISLSTTQLNLGTVETSGAFDVVSVGTSDVEYAVGPVPSWLSVSPDGGRIDAGARARLVVTIDRTAAPVGPVDVGIGISAVDGSGGGTVRVTAQVGGPPQIVSVVATPSVVLPEGCTTATGGATRAVVRVTAQDSTGVFAVEVVARLPDGRTITVPLTLDDATGDRSTWSGAVGPARVAGAVTFTVRAVDLDGLRSESTGSLTVDACPAP